MAQRQITPRPHNRQQNDAGAALGVLVCLTVFAAVFIIYTARSLPETVATHFGAHNNANGWMSRNAYVLFMLSFMIGISAFVSFAVGTLPRKFPQWTNLPNRDYWLAAERREDSLNFLNAHGKRLGCLVVMMMLGMHFVILKANHLQPPMLSVATFSSILLGFVVALIWWIVRLYRRFPRNAK